jgi:hypothetical protein
VAHGRGTAEREAIGYYTRSGACGTSGIGDRQSRKPLTEDVLWAAAIPAHKAPDAQHDGDRTATAGQIGKGAVVVTLDTSTPASAARAARSPPGQPRQEDDVFLLAECGLYLEVRHLGKQDGGEHGSSSAR